MAGKRFFNGSKSDQDLPAAEIRTKRPKFSLASVVEEVVMVNSFQNLFSSLEPLLRRVVNEEVEHVLRQSTRHFNRSSSLRIQALEPSSLQLVFTKNPLLPIFTGSKIQDVDGKPLEIQVVDKSGDQTVPFSYPHPVKVEIIVLDGDFPPRDDSWTRDQFDKNIVKERAGKRPLLHGDLTVTLRDGKATIGEIEFTDNSSWIRSRKFRIGARLLPGSNSQGLSVREALTEAFVVKDHRGELYKKHYPPKLEDDVWRLEKIGKEGAFHKKLSAKNINTVQDFLKLSVVDTNKLKDILGIGMSERMWEVTLKHAKTCEMGNKMYIYRPSQLSTIFLNPICQLVRAEINGEVFCYGCKQFSNNKAYFESLVKEAYANWNSLEVMMDVAIVNEISPTALLTQGDISMDQAQYHNQGHALAIKPFEQTEHQSEDNKAMLSMGYVVPSNVQMDSTDWMQGNTVLQYNNNVHSNNSIYGNINNTTGIGATHSESSSDGDILASRRFS